MFTYPTVLYRSALLSLRRPEALAAGATMAGMAMTSSALLATLLGCWRLGADPGWTNGFFVAKGPFSRYQVWFAAAIAAQGCAILLNRWAANREPVVPTPPPAPLPVFTVVPPPALPRP